MKRNPRYLIKVIALTLATIGGLGNTIITGAAPDPVGVVILVFVFLWAMMP